MNGTALLDCPFTVTTTGPLIVPEGTFAASVQLVGVAAVPLNVIVLVPCIAPKFAPLMVTVWPTIPDVGSTDVMLGGGTTLNTLDDRHASYVADEPELRTHTWYE